jgi:hypothetical protein
VGWRCSQFRISAIEPKVRVAAGRFPPHHPRDIATGMKSCAIMRPMIIDPVIGTLMLASIALLFASAGVHKLRDLTRFEEAFTAYQLLPAAVSTRLSWLVPVFELMVAAGLAAKISRPYAAALGIVLLSGYAGAIALNLRRGRRDLACGCGGPNDRRSIAPWMIGRNALIALGATAAFATWADRSLSLTDGITIVFGLLTIALVYLCVDQLFGNTQRAVPWGQR